MLKHLQPLRLQLAGIHQLLVVFPPRAHVAFLRDELGGFAVVGFQEVDGFLPFGEPEFVLGHTQLILLSGGLDESTSPNSSVSSASPSHSFSTSAARSERTSRMTASLR